VKEGKTAAKAKEFMTTAAKEAKEEKIFLCQEKKELLIQLVKEGKTVSEAKEFMNLV
jgi:hypothetical protein